MLTAIRTKRVIAISFLISAMVLIQFDYLSAQTPFRIEIGRFDDIQLGQTISIPIIKTGGSEEMAGFEFQFTYDTVALKILGVTPGALFDDSSGYRWEYFSYSLGGNSGFHCPVKVEGTADVDNGMPHPQSQYIANGTILFLLNFMVADSEAFECLTFPVRFYWIECQANTIEFFTSGSPKVALSNRVIDFDDGDITDTSGYLAIGGAPNTCLNPSDSTSPIRFIDFVNGRVDVACSGDIDARGDINLNGIANEIADAVVFANYFLYGLDAFTINVEGQIASTEINGDGYPLGLEDYVYLWGIIKGIFAPLPKAGNEFNGLLALTETDSSIIISGDFPDSVGALHFCFYAPDLMTPNDYRIHALSGVDSMNVLYDTHDDSLKILISPGMFFDSGLTAIGPGHSEIVEIVPIAGKPEFIYALAAGSLAQHINLTVIMPDNNPPAFQSYPGNLVNDYYGAFHFDFDAVDQNPLPDRITYQILSGPGEIDPATGIWTYAPLCKNIGETYTLTICASDRFHPCPQVDTTLHATMQLTITNQPPLVGDVDHSGDLNMIDMTYLINFLYRHGLPPLPSVGVGDLNGNGLVNILDITYMINRLFKNGPVPICP